MSPLASQLMEHCPPIHTRQHHVQHDQVVVNFQRLVQAIDSAGEQVCEISCLTQPLPKVFTGFGLVFNDQNFHKTFSYDRVCTVVCDCCEG